MTRESIQKTGLAAGQLTVREGSLDVAILAGPRVGHWPSAGVRALALLCAEMGLTTGMFGGDSMTVRGVIPLPGTGGIVLVEDVQKRIHRIRARAVVKVSLDSRLPDPFSGWRSQGLIPLSTAERLRLESHVSWDPATVVLGTGNEGLRFASRLLEAGAAEVYCVETSAQWGAKRFAGWEVEKRRFEAAGGRIVEAKPLSLAPKAALVWELRLQDFRGVRVLDVARVVSAGPFRDLQGVREHPPGSSLFELEQTARPVREDDVEGWVLEEERGRWLAGRIVKALATDLGAGERKDWKDRKDRLEQLYRRARGRLKRYFRHRDEPFTPGYQGKWMAGSDLRFIKAFGGAPKQDHLQRLVASVECFEQIPCNACMVACPEGAIDIGRIPRDRDILTESKCLSCGVCVAACPSSAIVMMRERGDHAMSSLVLPWRGSRPWRVGEYAIAVNRRGESLGSARVVALPEPGRPMGKDAVMDPPTDAAPAPPVPAAPKLERSNGVPLVSQLVQVELPTHLLWEARGIRRARAPATEDEKYMRAVERSEMSADKVEITLDGERRMARDRIPVTTALFEMGQSRPEDVLYCRDGSCGLCQVTIDGAKKLACQATVHRGMAIRLTAPPAPTQGPNSLCPCLGVTVEQVVERLTSGSLQSPEAVLAVTHVGEGKCHGQLCGEAFRRVLLDQGVDASQWADWRFPWSEWTLTP